MGKKRVTQILEQLKENQERDLQNAASIFTVAQIAVNELHEQARSLPQLPESSAHPQPIDKTSLLKQYGSYNGCRAAAKKIGIGFKRSPTWDQLVAAFSYQASLQQVAQSYLEAYPNPDLNGVSFKVQF